MSSYRRNMIVGLFALGAIVSLGILLVKFGESRFLFSNVYIVKARFEHISGIREGTEVRLAGVPVGRVLRVSLAQPTNPTEGVVGAMEIRRHIRIPIGWIAHVQTPLMGQPVINILPPSGQIVGQIPQEELKFHPIDGEAEIRGKLVNPLEQILDPEFMVALEKTTTQIGTLAEALTPAANAVTDLLQKRTIAQVESPDASEDMTANLYTAVERLHNVLMHVETVLGDPENQSNVQLLLENFRVASEDVRKAATGLNEFINEANVAATQASESMVSLNKTMLTSRERIDQIARKLMRNSDELSDILQHINSAARDVAEGKGTIGLLLRESEFHESLLLTVQRLGRAADELLVLIKQWQEKGILSRGN